MKAEKILGVVGKSIDKSVAYSIKEYKKYKLKKAQKIVKKELKE